MGSLLTRPSEPRIAPQSSSATPESAQLPVSLPEQAVERKENGQQLVRDENVSRKRQSQVTGSGVSDGKERDEASSPQTKKVRTPVKRKEKRRQDRQRGNKRRKSVVADVSDMYKVVDLCLQCDLCDKQFESQAEHICHKPCFYKRKGMTVEPVQWTCSECHKFFNRLSGLCQHMSGHFEGKYVCNLCSVTAKRRNVIVDHVTKQHM